VKLLASRIALVCLVSLLVPWGGAAEGAPLSGASVVAAAVQRGGEDILVCHKVGNNGFRHLYIEETALSSHRKHGDGLPGEAFPGIIGHVFGNDCTSVAAPKLLRCTCFIPFNDQELINRANAYNALGGTGSCSSGRARYTGGGELFELRTKRGIFGSTHFCVVTDTLNHYGVFKRPISGTGQQICAQEIAAMQKQIEWCGGS